jgi:tetratricopeptide (TPR) repeat protein
MSIMGMWSKPRLSVASSVRIRRAGMISLLFLLLHPLTLSQEKLPPSVVNQMAAGVQALKSGDLDTAEKVFSDALRHGVKHPLVFHNLGVIAQQRGLHHQAITWFREAILLQPDFGPTRLLLGSSLLAVGKNSEAIHELRRAVSLMPEQPEAHLQLARAYEGAENWIGAAREFQKLVELNPQEPEYHYRLGKSWTKVSQQSYQQIGRLNPDAARLHQALGQEYVIQEKYDLALDAYQQAARSDPRLPEIHLAMAVILLELKKFDEALAQIELERKLVPESKPAAEIKAKIEAAKGAGPR